MQTVSVSEVNSAIYESTAFLVFNEDAPGFLPIVFCI